MPFDHTDIQFHPAIGKDSHEVLYGITMQQEVCMLVAKIGTLPPLLAHCNSSPWRWMPCSTSGLLPIQTLPASRE